MQYAIGGMIFGRPGVLMHARPAVRGAQWYQGRDMGYVQNIKRDSSGRFSSSGSARPGGTRVIPTGNSTFVAPSVQARYNQVSGATRQNKERESYRSEKQAAGRTTQSGNSLNSMSAYYRQQAQSQADESYGQSHKIERFGTNLKLSASSAWNTVKAGATTVINKGRDFISNIFNKIKSFGSNVGRKISDMWKFASGGEVREAYENLQRNPSSETKAAFDAAQNRYNNSIFGKAKALIQRIMGSAKKAYGAAKTGVQNAAGAVRRNYKFMTTKANANPTRENNRNRNNRDMQLARG